MDQGNTTPFFSVCIPNFNYASYVGLTIQSVLDQTFKDFEIVVADNASTDNSMDVIGKYQAADSRIRVYRNRYNVGFAPNLQKATEKARGKYIILLSSDDLMYPDALEQYHKVISQHPPETQIVLHSGLDFVDPNGTVFMRHMKMDKPGEAYYFYEDSPLLKNGPGTISQDGAAIELNTDQVLRKAILKGKTPGFFLTVCYPRQLWEEVEGYDLNYMFGPDTFFLYKILSREPKLIYVRRSLFMYRVHPTNQNSLALKAGAIKQQIDKYIFTYSVDGKVLERLGLTRHDIEKSFIRTFCLRQSISALSEGLWLRGYKIYKFAWATYPGITLKHPLTYVNLFLILLGPITPLLLKFRKKDRNKEANG